MKHKLFALILALTVVSWAQTATQSTPSTSAPTTSDSSKCACCDKMAASSQDGHMSCMRQQHGDAKDTAAGKNGVSCCGGKDAKSCMKGDKTAASCCKDGCGKGNMATCCDRKAAKGCGKGCCGSNKSEKPA